MLQIIKNNTNKHPMMKFNDGFRELHTDRINFVIMALDVVIK